MHIDYEPKILEITFNSIIPLKKNIHITPLILSYNEEDNIKRVLERLKQFETVVIVDSFSTDGTVRIIKTFSNTVLFQRKFDTHTRQWNFGIEKVKTNWVLSLDSDYVLSYELLKEIRELNLDNEEISAYYFRFVYCLYDYQLKSGFLPPRMGLFDKRKSRYIQDGHTQLLETDRRTSFLKAPVYHDDRKPIDRWFNSQQKYSVLEFKKLVDNMSSKLPLADKIRKRKFLAPFLVFFYSYFLKRGFLDGKAGLYYALQRMYAELQLSLRLFENELKSRFGKN